MNLLMQVDLQGISLIGGVKAMLCPESDGTPMVQRGFIFFIEMLSMAREEFQAPPHN